MRRAPLGLLFLIAAVAIAPRAAMAGDGPALRAGSSAAKKASPEPGAIQGGAVKAPKRPGRRGFGDITLKKGYAKTPAPKSPAAIRNVDGVDSDTEVVEFEAGEDVELRKRPGRAKYGDITLKKGYSDVPAPKSPSDR